MPCEIRIIGIDIEANSGASIETITVGFSGAVAAGQGAVIGIAGAGSVSVNKVANTTIAVDDEGFILDYPGLAERI